MKLVMIYGPPASGKLTVAEALVKITGFKLLHNHLIVDICSAVFSRDSFGFLELNLDIRSLILEVASKYKTDGIISTFTYYSAGKKSSPVLDYLPQYRFLVEKTGGELCLVRLCCDQGELEKRILAPSRINTKKLTNIDKFRRVMEEERPNEEIPPGVMKGLSIDNTSLSPVDVALQIKSFYSL